MSVLWLVNGFQHLLNTVVADIWVAVYSLAAQPVPEIHSTVSNLSIWFVAGCQAGMSGL